MADRPRQPLPFGGGVDRSTGPLVVEPTSYLDLRNVKLSEGWMAARKGLQLLLDIDAFTAAEPAVGPAVTLIIGIAPLRSQGVNVVITYQASTNDCAAWLLTGTLATLTYIDSFWTLDPAAQTPPIVSLADSYDKLFVAHDEPVFALRQITQVVTVSAMTVADLNGGIDLGNLRFRVVRRYLNYLFGAGHGTAAEPDHPEVVRNSIAGDPLTYDPDHYFIAGQRGDPVLSLDAAGDVLNARKQTESYDIVGFSPDTFGIRPGDRNFGIAGTQLSITVGKVSYFWSLEGPRASGGAGDSTDLALLLALDGPSPDPLASVLDYTRGFAVYQPVVREVLFIFGEWAYVLHLADEQRKRWSFRQYGVPLACGGLAFQTQDDLFPSAHAEMGASTVTDTTIDQLAEIVGTLLGGEVAEWWLLDPNITVWQLYATNSVPSGSTEIENLYSGLLPDEAYILAVRLKRNGLATADYASTNPNDWPATARKVVTTAPSDPGGGPVPPGPPPGGTLGNIVALTQVALTPTFCVVNADLDGDVDGTEELDYSSILPTVRSYGNQGPGGIDPDTNTFEYTPLNPNTSYVLTVRLLRGGVPTPPYANDDPWTWPSESRLTLTTPP